MKLLFLEFCYQKSEYLVGVYMEMEINYLIRTGRGIKHCFMVYLQGMSHKIEINVTLYFIINFEISLVNFLNVLGFLLLASEKTESLRFTLLFFSY